MWPGWQRARVFALTPVAALMFRFNNPDSLMVLLMVAGAYCMTRALERGSTRWVLAAGTMVGFAFLAKMLEGFMVLPAFALVYLVAAPVRLRRRIWQVLAGGAAVAVSAGWWVAIVALWPAASRPFIDGSPDNNIFNLIFGYNGLDRLSSGGGPGGGGGGGASFSGPASLLRLFNDLMGGQGSWLLPAALLGLGVALWARRRAPRVDRMRAAALMWGGWLIVTAVVFSLSSGIIHTYYTVALAPAIGALVAIGGAALWPHRSSLGARSVAAVAVCGTAVWAYVLLDRTPSWEPWLRFLVLACGLVAAAALLAGPSPALRGRRFGAAVAVLATVAMIAGPAAYAAQTISTASHRLDPIGRAGDGGWRRVRRRRRSRRWRAGWWRRSRTASAAPGSPVGLPSGAGAGFAGGSSAAFPGGAGAAAGAGEARGGGLAGAAAAAAPPSAARSSRRSSRRPAATAGWRRRADPRTRRASSWRPAATR